MERFYHVAPWFFLLLLTGLTSSCFPEPVDHGAKEVRLICESDAHMGQEAIFVLAYDDQVKLGHLPSCAENMAHPYLGKLREQKNYINDQFYLDSNLLAGYYLLRPSTDCLTVHQVIQWQGGDTTIIFQHERVGLLQPGRSDIQLPPSHTTITGDYVRQQDTITILGVQPNQLNLEMSSIEASAAWIYHASVGLAFGSLGRKGWLHDGELVLMDKDTLLYSKR